MNILTVVLILGAVIQSLAYAGATKEIEGLKKRLQEALDEIEMR